MDAKLPRLDRKNNFDLIRLVMAFGIMVFHYSVLTDAPSLKQLYVTVDFGEVLACFFILSGFMVFPSYEKSSSLKEYAVKRIRRIYPAYAVVILLAALLGAALTTLPISGYITSPALYKYIAYNLLTLNFMQPALPGVFESNPMIAMNGALWTIKVELMFYVAVPIIVWLMRRLGRIPVIVVLYALGMAYNMYFSALHQSTGREMYFTLAKQLPGQLPYLMSGALLYYYLDAFRRKSHLYFAIALAVYAPSYAMHFKPLMPIALTVMLVYAGVTMKHMGNFGRFGDFSYGIYIFHFPTIQTLIYLGMPAASLGASFALAVVMVSALAFASWHLVEKRSLMSSSHYVQAAVKG